MSDPTTSGSAGSSAGSSTPDALSTETTEVVADEQQGVSVFGRARKKLGEATESAGAKLGEFRAANSQGSDEVSASSLGASAGAASGVTSGTATSGTGDAAVTRRTRKARLRLHRVDPWSVMKTVLLFSIAGGIVFFVATWVVWGVINASGVFSSVNKAVNDLVASPGAEASFRLEDYVNTHKVLGLAALVSAIDVVLFTALATLFSFLYNLAASVMGGLEVTLAED